MKKFLTAISIFMIGSVYANAKPAPISSNSHPTAFAGIVGTFNGDVGLSIKILSTNKENKGAFSGGVSYYPVTNKFGLSAGGGYVFKNGAATAEWDFLNWAPQIGLGYADTKDDTLMQTI